MRTTRTPRSPMALSQRPYSCRVAATSPGWWPGVVGPRFTPGQNMGVKPSWVAASIVRPRPRAGTVSSPPCCSFWRDSALLRLLSPPTASRIPTPTIAMASITSAAQSELRTAAQRCLGGRLGRALRAAPRHRAPVLAPSREIDDAHAAEERDELAEADRLDHRVQGEAGDVGAARVAAHRVLLEQQRGERQQQPDEDRDDREEHHERDRHRVLGERDADEHEA